MLKFLLALGFFSFSGLRAEEEKKFEYKNWKIFQSDFGYEFKYPDCWEVVNDDTDDVGDLKQVHSLVVQEGEACKTTRKDKYKENGIGFWVGKAPLKPKKEYEEEVNNMEALIKKRLASNYSLAMKDQRTENSYSFIRVFWTNSLKNNIRWDMELFCPTRKISISGLSIDSPDPSYFEKFKTGDLALPEPEKTIYESFRCIEPKKIEKKKVDKKNSRKNKSEKL